MNIYDTSIDQSDLSGCLTHPDVRQIHAFEFVTRPGISLIYPAVDLILCHYDPYVCLTHPNVSDMCGCLTYSNIQIHMDV